MLLDYNNHYYILNDYSFGKININVLFSFFLTYSLIYKALEKSTFPKYKIYQFSNKLVSGIHSMISFYGAYKYINDGLDYETWNNKYIMITKMYLLYDTILCMYSNEGIQILFHHIIFYFGVGYNELKYSYFIAQALLAEITNINLHFGWFLLTIKYNKTKIFKINAIILIILFFIFRVLNYINLSYVSLITFTKMYGFSNGAFLINGLGLRQVYWFKKLVEKIKEKC